jgi:AAA family ATP:ADP antiporter
MQEAATARTALMASVAVGLAIGQQVIARASRDALYLTQYDATRLPQVMLAAAGFSLVIALVSGHWMVERGPRAVMASLGLISAAIFGVEGALLDTAPNVIATANYIQVTVIGAMIVSGLWSIINERFDPYSARRRFARIGSGATLGGIIGGLLAHALSEYDDLRLIFWTLSGLSVAVSLAGWLIGPPLQRPSTEKTTTSGLRAIKGSPYLMRIATVVAVLGAAGALLDYAMKATAETHFGTTASLLSFFGIFYTVTSVGTLLVQLFLARPVLQRLGLGAALVSLPAAVAAAAGIGVIWTRLATVALAKALEKVLANSLFHSGYELLYSPIAPRQKRSVKAFIDVACDKVGDGVGSLIVLTLVAVTATPAISWVLFFAVVASLVALTATLALRKGYVEQLAVSLRSGSLELGRAGLVDLTTRHSLTTATGLDPQALAAIIRSAEQIRAPDSAWREQLQTLLSGAKPRVLALLASDELSPHVGPVLIELLAEDQYARPTQDALQRLAPRMTGQIVDALLDSSNPQVVRRRIPRTLLEVKEPKAIEGLLDGLRDTDPQVRLRCGQALSKMKQARPKMTFTESRILALVRKETRSARELDHVFNLLSLILDRGALFMAFRALRANDGSLRGTALEYLSQVLPEQVRADLWPLLLDRAAVKSIAPTTRDVAELLRSMESGLVDGKEGK